MDNEQQPKKKYLIAYFYPPKSSNVNFIHLHSETYEDALRMARCMFGNTAHKHLYYKNIEESNT